MELKLFLKQHGRQLAAASVILVFGVGLMAVLATTKKETNKRDIVERIRMVELLPVDFHDITLEVEGNGTIEATRTLDLVSVISGPVVYSRDNLRSGMTVSAGEVLVRIDNREAANRVYQTRSSLINSIVSLIPDLKVNANSSAYQKWNNYLESLDVDRETPDLPVINDPQERIRVSMQNIFTQYYQTKNAEITLARHTITAPFDGYLTRDGVIQGAWVTPGQVVASITDPLHLQISVPLALPELKLLNSTQQPRAMIQAPDDPENLLLGKVLRWNTSLDRLSQTVQVHVEFTNPDLDPHFLPGNYVDVRIAGKTLNVVTRIPRENITPEGYVFVYQDSTLGRVPVDIVAYQGSDAIVSRGALVDGAEVVTTLLQNPLVGMPVAPARTEISVADTPAVITNF